MMIRRYFAVVSELSSNERFLLKIRRSEYLSLRRKLIKIASSLDGRKTIKKYPCFKKGRNNYVVFSVLKELKIEDIKPIDVFKFTKISKR